jgi:type I restriction enzyme R subunit
VGCAKQRLRSTSGSTAIPGPAKEQKAGPEEEICAPSAEQADQVIYMRAFVISEHYRSAWQGTGLKAQHLSRQQGCGLQYHGIVRCRILVLEGSSRAGSARRYEATDEEPGLGGEFWQKMMKASAGRRIRK